MKDLNELFEGFNRKYSPASESSKKSVEKLLKFSVNLGNSYYKDHVSQINKVLEDNVISKITIR